MGGGGITWGYDATDSVDPARWRPPFRFSGEIRRVVLDLSGPTTLDPTPKPPGPDPAVRAEGEHRMPMQPEETFAAAEDAMHEEARQVTGLDDFGDAGYLTALGHLSEALDRDADLSPRTCRMARSTRSVARS